MVGPSKVSAEEILRRELSCTTVIHFIERRDRMIVGVPRETFPGERRVALVPSSIPTLAKGGLEVLVEAGAGAQAGYPDAEYVAKGAKIIPERRDLFAAAEIVVQVLSYGSNDRTGQADLPLFHSGQVLIGFLRPLGAVGRSEERRVG